MKLLKNRFSEKQRRLFLNLCIRIYLFPLFIAGFAFKVYDKYTKSDIDKKNINYKINMYE